MDKETCKKIEGIFVEMKRHLCTCIIPFWYRRIDRENGGFRGYMSYDLEDDMKAVKGGILNSRILWFFSKAAIAVRDGIISKEDLAEGGICEKALGEAAEHAYKILKDKFYDKENGGIFWSLSYDGKPYDTTKHTYAQAFAIYGLAAFYELTGKKDALETAIRLHKKIEEKCHDEGGYGEAFAVDFTPASNEKLSENGVMAGRTMNTLLHVYEGYSELLRAVTGKEEYKDEAKKLAKELTDMLHTFIEKVYNKELHRQEVFFDKNWNTLIDLWSYGHDIESSWLLDYGMDVLVKAGFEGDFADISTECADALRDLEVTLRENIFDGNSLPAECEKGVEKKNRIWWVQAETVNGFLWNGVKYDDKKDIDCAAAEWAYIKEHSVDKRKGSEWFWELDENGDPIEGRPIVEEWKCPYHNGRMVLLLLKIVHSRSECAKVE